MTTSIPTMTSSSSSLAYRTKDLKMFYCRHCKPSYVQRSGLVCRPCGEEICCLDCYDKVRTYRINCGSSSNDVTDDLEQSFIQCDKCLRMHLKKVNKFDYPLKSSLDKFKVTANNPTLSTSETDNELALLSSQLSNPSSQSNLLVSIHLTLDLELKNMSLSSFNSQDDYTVPSTDKNHN